MNMDAHLLDEPIVRGKYRVTLPGKNHKKGVLHPRKPAHHTRHTKMAGLNSADSNIAEPPAVVRHMAHHTSIWTIEEPTCIMQWTAATVPGWFLPALEF